MPRNLWILNKLFTIAQKSQTECATHFPETGPHQIVALHLTKAEAT